MSTVGAGFSMSLDGFVAGVGDDVSRVFQWMFMGNTDMTVTIGEEDLDLKVSEESAQEIQEMHHGIGAIIAGRRVFEVAGAWGGKHPMNVPVIVMTHNPPQEWLDKEGSPFTFVTDGVESALAKAKALAGGKMIGIGSPNITRQFLKAGLLEEIAIDLVPVLLGDGIRLFEHLGIEPIDLEITGVTSSPNVTHLRYRVAKKS